jgi:hypothetical protein
MGRDWFICFMGMVSVVLGAWVFASFFV